MTVIISPRNLGLHHLAQPSELALDDLAVFAHLDRAFVLHAGPLREVEIEQRDARLGEECNFAAIDLQQVDPLLPE